MVRYRTGVNCASISLSCSGQQDQVSQFDLYHIRFSVYCEELGCRPQLHHDLDPDQEIA